MTVNAVVIRYEVFTPTYTCTTAIESNVYTDWTECHESEVISIRHRVRSFERDYNQFLYMNKENENMDTCRNCDQLLDDHCPECDCCNYSDGECLNCLEE